VIAAVVLAVAVPVGVWSTVLRPGASAWWVALAAWSPALPALVARRVHGGSAAMIGVSWTLCAIGLGVSLSLVWFYSRKVNGPAAGVGGPAPVEWRTAAWILGIATSLSGLVPWLS